jgi:putative hemolysin
MCRWISTLSTTYTHLFLWDTERQAIGGGYRFGPCRELMAAGGVDALYTSTLFQFSEPMVAQLDGAIEVGRSFLLPEYQRKNSSLLVLWRGIGRYLVDQMPGRHTLFGAVSVTNRFSLKAQSLIVWPPHPVSHPPGRTVRSARQPVPTPGLGTSNEKAS